MAQTGTGRRNGHTRQRPATAKAKATSKAKPRRGSANGSGKQAAAASGAASTNGASKTTGTARKTTGAARKTTGAARKTASTTRKTASTTRKTASTTRKTASTAGKAAEAGKAVAKVTPKPTALARKFALKALKKAAETAANAGAGVIRNAADRAASAGNGTVGRAIDTVTENPVQKLAHQRLPIQRSVDIAVPLRVAWEEWLMFESLPEGAHTVSDIERDDNVLSGRTDGPRPAGWEAEILDERSQQSFAWQSHQGSDCAGLITFHRLSERLTRLELNLDIVPTSLAEAAQLTTRIADRRAEAELRRFKARLELINPDLYQDDEADEPAELAETEEASGDASAHEDGPQADADQADQEDGPQDGSAQEQPG